jgi:hypothetical protein
VGCHTQLQNEKKLDTQNRREISALQGLIAHRTADGKFALEFWNCITNPTTDDRIEVKSYSIQES